MKMLSVVIGKMVGGTGLANLGCAQFKMTFRIPVQRRTGYTYLIR